MPYMHRIHGTNGIFTYIYHIKINHSCIVIGKFTVRPMDPMGTCMGMVGGNDEVLPPV